MKEETENLQAGVDTEAKLPSEVQFMLWRMMRKGLTCAGILDNGAVLLETPEGEIPLYPGRMADFLSHAQYEEHLDALLQAALERRLPDDWYRARRGLRVILEPADQDFSGVVHRPVGDGIMAVLVHTDLLEQRIAWVGKVWLDRWAVSEEDAWDWATGTMRELLKRAEIQVVDVDGHPVAMLVTPSCFKAGMLLLPELQERLSTVLGPGRLLVAVPCWDVAYLLNERSSVLVQDLRRVVGRDFAAATRPVSTQILRLGAGKLESLS